MCVFYFILFYFIFFFCFSITSQLYPRHSCCLTWLNLNDCWRRPVVHTSTSVYTECMFGIVITSYCLAAFATFWVLMTRWPNPHRYENLKYTVSLFAALGVHNDNFTQCPACDLDWSSRRYRIVEEISHYSPDVIGLQASDAAQGHRVGRGQLDRHVHAISLLMRLVCVANGYGCK